MICTHGPLLLYARRTPAPQVAVTFSYSRHIPRLVLLSNTTLSDIQP
jgi:hypothetical protein